MELAASIRAHCYRAACEWSSLLSLIGARCYHSPRVELVDVAAIELLILAAILAAVATVDSSSLLSQLWVCARCYRSPRVELVDIAAIELIPLVRGGSRRLVCAHQIRQFAPSESQPGERHHSFGKE